MIQVTSREFRDRQAGLFELADKGEQVIIKRKGKKSYALVPIEDEDFCLSPEAEERIARSREQYKNGDFVSCKNAEEAIKLLESL